MVRNAHARSFSLHAVHERGTAQSFPFTRCVRLWAVCIRCRICVGMCARHVWLLCCGCRWRKPAKQSFTACVFNVMGFWGGFRFRCANFYSNLCCSSCWTGATLVWRVLANVFTIRSIRWKTLQPFTCCENQSSASGENIYSVCLHRRIYTREREKCGCFRWCCCFCCCCRC